jgi:hypothetical protein
VVSIWLCIKEYRAYYLCLRVILEVSLAWDQSPQPAIKQVQHQVSTNFEAKPQNSDPALKLALDMLDLHHTAGNSAAF